MVPRFLILDVMLSGANLKGHQPPTPSLTDVHRPQGEQHLVHPLAPPWVQKGLLFLTDIFGDLRFLLKSTNVFETRLSHFFANVLYFFQSHW